MNTAPTTTNGSFCAACGSQLSEGARFCHRCGAAAGSTARRATGAGTLPWAVAALSLIALVALIAGRSFGGRPRFEAASGGPVRAPDISSMPPQERASRLFNRVMQYASQGRLDSAAFFAPMAIGAIEALGPLGPPQRYQIGLVALASGDRIRASAEADSVLSDQPGHLLALMLAQWTAEARGDSAAMRRFARRLVEAEVAERARRLPEYEAFAIDINNAIATAKSLK